MSYDSFHDKELVALLGVNVREIMNELQSRNVFAMKTIESNLLTTEVLSVLNNGASQLQAALGVEVEDAPSPR